MEVMEGLEVAEPVETAEQPAEEATAESKDEAKETLTPEQEIAQLRERLAAAEQERDKFKSQNVGRLRANERDEAVHSRLDRLSESIANNNETLTALLEHLAAGEGDPEKLRAKIGDIQTKTKDLEAKQQALVEFEDHFETKRQELQQLVNGQFKGDEPELEEAAKVWNAARKNQDRVGLERALRLVERVVNQAKLSAQQANQPKRNRREDLEMAVPKAGGAPATPQDIIARLSRGEIEVRTATPAEKAVLRSAGIIP